MPRAIVNQAIYSAAVNLINQYADDDDDITIESLELCISDNLAVDSPVDRAKFAEEK